MSSVAVGAAFLARRDDKIKDEREKTTALAAKHHF
jgi:hypothetical protein